MKTVTLPSPDELLAALDPEQRKVAVQVRGFLAVHAGAGTGKTRAITYRIAYGVATGAFAPSSVLALSFTTKAAAEMKERLALLGVPGVQTRTFHSAALAQLRYFWPSVIGGQVPAITETKSSLVFTAAQRLGITVDKTTVRDIAAEIEWAKVSLIDPADYRKRITELQRPAPAGLDPHDVERLIDAYEDAKEEKGVIDFEDIMLILAGMLQERRDILTQIQRQYSTFVVDEYQDISPLQHHLLTLWLGNRKDLCVVGDVAQTIYSFAGASPHYLHNFRTDHPGANIVTLNRDYRSTPEIVAAANALMATTGPGTVGAVTLVSQRNSGAAIEYTQYDNDQAEASAVAQRIRSYVSQGIKLSQIAILYRTNSQSERFESALSAQGIPYILRGGATFFEREEIKKAMVILQRLAAQVAGGAAQSGSVSEMVADALTTVGWDSEPPAETGAVRERWDNLNALYALTQTENYPDLPTFFTSLNDRARMQAAPTVEGITLSSLHAAKGLEWPVVFIVGASEGLLPISHAKTAEAREEERRLFYVGITRARDALHISWAGARGDNLRANRKRSRFLEGLISENRESGARRGRKKPSAHNVSQTRGRSFSDADTLSGRQRARKEVELWEDAHSSTVIDLYQRLKQWRSQTAKEEGKPAYSVITDKTLRYIAEAAPRNRTQMRVIPGVGAVKNERYGDAVLAIVRKHQDSEDSTQ